MWSHTLPNSDSKGFTLIEVVVGVALLATVMTLIYTTTYQSIRAKEKVDRRREIYHDVRVALNKVSQDISMAFLLNGDAQTGRHEGRPTLSTVLRGIDSGNRDQIYFATLGHLRLFRGAKESESAEVGYQVENDPKADKFDSLRIMRRESKWVDEDPEEGGSWFPLIGNVKHFNLEYYDAKKREWFGDWSSEGDLQKGRLPRAVKISIGVADPDRDGETLIFQTMSLVGMYANPFDF